VRTETLGVAENASVLIDGDIPACTLEVADGVLGAACRLVKEAVTVMTLDGRDELIRDDLIRATTDAFIRSDRRRPNPFVTGLHPLKAAA
jgi:hypothetical protein